MSARRTPWMSGIERTKEQFDVGADGRRDDDITAPSLLVAE